jgi:hypothetical protein
LAWNQEQLKTLISISEDYMEKTWAQNVPKTTNLSKFLQKIESKNNEESIEESTKYFYHKFKPVELKEEDLVLKKGHNFLNKNEIPNCW